MSVAVISWSRDVDLSQMDARCLRLLLHSAAWCRLPVQLLKHSCFKSYCFLRLPTVTILLHLTHPRSVALQLTHLLCVGVTSFVWKVFSRLRNRLEFGGFSGFASLSSTGLTSFQAFTSWDKIPSLAILRVLLLGLLLCPLVCRARLSHFLTRPSPKCLQRLHVVHELLEKFVNSRRLGPCNDG